MDREKRKQVDRLLDRLVSEKELTLLHAVESGSRAWGFESKDSDYDVRFVYVRPKDWYLSVFGKNDVVNPVFDGDMDAAGWDVRKSLSLMSNGNAVIFEWLFSPVVYRSEDKVTSMLRELSKDAFNPLPVFHHYRSLAKRKLHEDKVYLKPKSFMYALRATLCAKWVALEGSVPPVAFSELVDALVKDNGVRQAVERLLTAKRDLTEAEEFSVEKGLVTLLEQEFNDLDADAVTSSGKLPVDRYDDVFRSILRMA